MSTKNLKLHNLGAEESVLGAILRKNEALKNVDSFLTAEMFFSEKNRIIYSKICELIYQFEPADPQTIAEKLGFETLDKMGGLVYFDHLFEITPTASNIEYYAKIVREKALLRQLLSTRDEIYNIVSEASEGMKTIEDAIDEAQKNIFAVQAFSGTKFEIATDVIEQIQKDAYDSVHNKKSFSNSIPTGITALDTKITGLANGNLTILAARPSMGKTALALQIAEYISKDRVVAFFSYEMTTRSLVERMLCQAGRIDGKRLRTQDLNERDLEMINAACNKIRSGSSNLFICDKSDTSIAKARAMLRDLQRDKGLALAIFDYLQIIPVPPKENRFEVIGQYAQDLRAVAKDFDIPVLCLSQLNRKCEERGKNDKRPILSDLESSGKIEQAADLVAFIYRDCVYNKDADEAACEINVEKYRHGRPGMVKVRFESQYMRFDSITTLSGLTRGNDYQDIPF